MHVRTLVPAVAIALVVAACGSTSSESTPTDNGHMHGETIEIDPATTVALNASKDTMGGWNLQIDIAGMRLAPENAGLEHQDGEGHMHLYVDGVKTARVYTPWFHLGELEPGEHELRVTLNSNSHADLAIDGQLVQASTIVQQPAPSDGMHGHMEMSHEAATPMTVDLTVEKDPKMGWNAFIETTGFTWAPEHASMGHVEGEGHAHIYIDGVKIGRLYGEAFHFQFDQPGTRIVEVSLNGNDHAPYLWGGEPVEATFAIYVEGEPVEADHIVEVSVSDGDVTGPARVEVATGDVVEIRITSDAADTLHVHGYDAYRDIRPGEEAVLTLTATIPGIFEVELEGAGLDLFDLVIE